MAEPATGARVTTATAAKRRPAQFDGVVMTRTPLRLSFAGGGTDLAAFYDHEPGAVFSTAIARYIYVTVKRHGGMFDEQDFTGSEALGTSRQCTPMRVSPRNNARSASASAASSSQRAARSPGRMNAASIIGEPG